MGAPEKPNAMPWRPSQTTRDREQNSHDGKTANEATDVASAEWRPSRLAAERLSSLSPKPSRKRFRMPRGVRALVTVVLAVCLLYVFGKLWLEPEAGQLRPALAIFIGALILLIAAAVVGAALQRRRKRADDKSTLRL